MKRNSSNINFYYKKDEEIQDKSGNHDMTGSEFLSNFKDLLEEYRHALPADFGESDEYKRLRNWTEYEKLEV